jgi:hypothetical protein
MKRSISAFAAAVACVGACAGTAAARTADSSAATQTCGKVSAASVSAIVGYKVPSGIGETLSEKATKKNDDIAYQLLSCSFGSETSLAGLKKSVAVSIETLSRSLTSAELKKLVSLQHETGLNLKIEPYSGLGAAAYYMAFSDGGFRVQSIVTASGTKLYGATVQSNISTSKLASLVKLAEKL